MGLMTECPTCKLSMESHSTAELIECCMKQTEVAGYEESKGVCPSCKHRIDLHGDAELAECTIAFLGSGISESM